MQSLDEFRKAGEEIYRRLNLSSYPVAITYIQNEDEIPEGTFRPSSAGKKLSLCQAYTLSRKWGMQVAMTSEDNFCTPATAFHGWVDISMEDLIESQVRQGWHKDRQAEERRIAGVWQLLRSKQGNAVNEYCGFVCSPLKDAQMLPHTVLIFGEGVQITHMIHAICYGYTDLVHSFFEGFGESCIKGGLLPFLIDSAQVVLPGMGDRSFSGIGENELAIGMPSRLVPVLLENLFKAGGVMNMGFPAKTMLPMDITETITPGFQFLQEKMEKPKP
ncbi:MAG: DUF169 domain-containing protein [Desulfomonilia bacterium]